MQKLRKPHLAYQVQRKKFQTYVTSRKASHVQQTDSEAPLDDQTSNPLRNQQGMPWLTLQEDEQDLLCAFQHYDFKQGDGPLSRSAWPACFLS
jgi:hypothetical protein